MILYNNIFVLQVRDQVKLAYAQQAVNEPTSPAKPSSQALPKIRRTENSRIQEAVKGIALCHNVTPVWENSQDTNDRTLESQSEADQHYYTGQSQQVVYQASSPDEVSIIYK